MASANTPNTSLRNNTTVEHIKIPDIDELYSAFLASLEGSRLSHNASILVLNAALNEEKAKNAEPQAENEGLRAQLKESEFKRKGLEVTKKVMIDERKALENKRMKLEESCDEMQRRIVHFQATMEKCAGMLMDAVQSTDSANQIGSELVVVGWRSRSMHACERNND